MYQKFELPPDPAKGRGATIAPVYNNAIISETERAKIRDLAGNIETEDLNDWLNNLFDYAANLCEPVSPMWERYAGRPGLEVSTSFAYSGRPNTFNDDRLKRLKVNAADMHSEKCDIVSSPRQFAMGIIANDDYEPTIAFVHRMFCAEHGVGFGEQIEGFGVIAEKVAHHMRRMFWAKWEYMIPRPAQVMARRVGESGAKNYMLPPFAAPHPGHPSWGAGHATCFYAALAECEKHYRCTGSPMLHQTADEGGMLRCDLFLHYPQDIEFSFRMVHAFVPDVSEV